MQGFSFEIWLLLGVVGVAVVLSTLLVLAQFAARQKDVYELRAEALRLRQAYMERIKRNDVNAMVVDEGPAPAGFAQQPEPAPARKAA